MTLMLCDAAESIRPRPGKRKPYCLPCKKRRVKCDMAQPVCVRCQRNTRRAECVYDGPTSSSSSPTSDEEDSPIGIQLINPLQVDSNTIFETVFHLQWLPTASLLSRSTQLTSMLVGESTTNPGINAAIRAIGALKINHPTGSAYHYSKALTATATTIHAQRPIDAVMTITLILCYEMLSNSGWENYIKHLDVIGVLLRQQVAVQRRVVPSPLAVLICRSLRGIETLESCLAERVPRLTFKQWSILIPSKSGETDMDNLMCLRFMNLGAALTAKDVRHDQDAIRHLLAEVIDELNERDYADQIHECSVRVRQRDDITCPYDTDLCLYAETHMVTAVVLLTTLLRLQTFLTTTFANLISSAEQINRLVNVMLANPNQAITAHSLPSCVYALFNVHQTFTKVGVSDHRFLWAQSQLFTAYGMLTS